MKYDMEENGGGERLARGVIRLILGLCALAGWYVALRFSVMGFNAWKSGMEWAAYCIVAFTTGLQLLVNHTGREEFPNLTLSTGGIISYGYGIITNIMGILAIGGTTLSAVSANLRQDWWMLALAICIGVPLELAPESMLMKAMFPQSRNMISDALRGVSDAFNSLFSQRPSVSSMRDRNPNSFHPQPPRQPGTRSVPDSLRQRQQVPQPGNSPAPQPAIRPAPTYHTINEFEDDDD